MLSALKYEMQLAEATSNAGPQAALSEERIDLCFSILGQLLQSEIVRPR